MPDDYNISSLYVTLHFIGEIFINALKVTIGKMRAKSSDVSFFAPFFFLSLFDVLQYINGMDMWICAYWLLIYSDLSDFSMILMELEIGLAYGFVDSKFMGIYVYGWDWLDYVTWLYQGKIQPDYGTGLCDRIKVFFHLLLIDFKI